MKTEQAKAPLLLSGPPGSYLLTDDGRRVYVGYEIPPGCRTLRAVVPSTQPLTLFVETQNGDA